MNQNNEIILQRRIVTKSEVAILCTELTAGYLTSYYLMGKYRLVLQTFLKVIFLGCPMKEANLLLLSTENLLLVVARPILIVILPSTYIFGTIQLFAELFMQ